MPLTPAQVEAMVAEYRRTVNVSAAGRAAGVDSGVAHKCLKRVGELNKEAVYAKARERGIRNAKRTVELASEKLHEQIASGELAAQALATVSNAAAKVLDSLVSAQTNGVRLEETRERIAKLKAETELLQAKARGEVKDVTVVAASEQAVDELMRKHFGSPGTLYKHDGAPEDKGGA